ncbi:hypothetical protein Tco_0863423 [Tanacetum coccineum]
MISSLNDEIDFRISFDDSDDEDYTVIFDKNSFSYKIISVNNMKTDSENDNEKVNMPLFPSPKPTVSCFNDLDFFKDFKNEFPAIVYNDAPTSKSDLLIEPNLNPQHINEFDLKDETSLSEYDEEEQNVLYFNDLFPFNIIQPDDLKSEKDNDDNEVDIIQSSGDMALPLRGRCTGCRFGKAVLYLDTLGALQFQLGGDRRRLSWRQFILALGLHTTIRESHMLEISLAQPYPTLLLGIRYLSYATGMEEERARLVKHFGLLTEERFWGLTVIAPTLPVIDMAELGSLKLCGRAPGVAQDALAVDEGVQAISAPVQALPPPAAAARTMPQRMARLEEDLHEIRGALAE